jgi:hypothetical protein
MSTYNPSYYHCYILAIIINAIIIAKMNDFRNTPNHDLLKLLLGMAALQLEFDGFGFCQVAWVLKTVWSIKELNFFFIVSRFIPVLHVFCDILSTASPNWVRMVSYALFL